MVQWFYLARCMLVRRIPGILLLIDFLAMGSWEFASCLLNLPRVPSLPIDPLSTTIERAQLLANIDGQNAAS